MKKIITQFSGSALFHVSLPGALPLDNRPDWPAYQDNRIAPLELSYLQYNLIGSQNYYHACFFQEAITET